MACARPLISVYSEKGESCGKNVTLPAVFKASIRSDIVNFVHTNLRKNNRQPYAVIKPVLSLGVLAELWLEFPEFEAEGLTVLARVLLEICVMGAACLHQPKPGADGIVQ
ncbi:hypothetical protein GH733_005892 [Mirounga leonina]|nr:hypothetical protein GH733_005892 [Mirounga leonina]